MLKLTQNGTGNNAFPAFAPDGSEVSLCHSAPIVLALQETSEVTLCAFLIWLVRERMPLLAQQMNHSALVLMF